MKIERRARERQAVRASFTLDNLQFEWDSKARCVIGTQRNTAGDFSTNSRKYDFHIRLSSQEVARLAAVALEAALGGK
jgi:hypothetical protein